MVYIIATGGHAVVARARKQHLIELQVAEVEVDHGACQVEPPGADKVDVIHAPHHILMLIKTFQPGLQGLGIVKAQVFHIEY